MDWKRRNSIANLVDGILERNVMKQPPILLIHDIMKERDIKFEERNESDAEFCGVYMIMKNTKIIFVNSNLYEPRKNFTIAHELGHHFLGHPLDNNAIVCNKSAFDSKNKERPEREKEADYFASCFLMPKNLIQESIKEFEKNHSEQENSKKLQEYLCERFKVSKETMRYRLDELKMI